MQVVHSGTVNNNLNTAYNLDKADNRVNVTVTGDRDLSDHVRMFIEMPPHVIVAHFLGWAKVII